MPKEHEEIIGATIESLQEDINALQLVNKELLQQQINFRDKIAVKIFINEMKRLLVFPTHDRTMQIAKKSYEMSDHFMRIKETI